MQVADAVQAIAAAVRSGNFAKATSIANSAHVPLAVTTQQLQVGALISNGAESAVYHATYQGGPAAVKRPRITTSADLDRFRRELCILATLQHPHIIHILAAKAIPPDYGLVLPWYPKVASDQLHHHGWRPSWHRVVTLAMQLTSALQHIHDKGIVHRDMKTGNVLLTEDAQHCVVIDFGIAAYVDELDADVDTRATAQVSRKPSGGFHKAQMVGTLEYMAPEVLLKCPHSQHSDVYALATTINELATGIVPFSDCTRDNPKAHTILEMGYGRQELAAAVCTEKLRPLPRDDTPPLLLQLLEACWHEQPTARPSAAQVLEALCKLLTQLGDDSIPAGTSVQATATAATAGAAVAIPASTSVQAAATAATTPAAGAAAGAGVSTNQPQQQQPPAAGAGVSTSQPQPPAPPLTNGHTPPDQPATPAPPSLGVAWPPPTATANAYAPHIAAGRYLTAGRRGVDKMEDTVVVVSPWDEDDGRHVHLLSVFDGHRGEAAARFAQDLVQHVVCEGAGRGMEPERALEYAFVELDIRFRMQQDMQWAQHVASTGGATGPRPWPGATALVVLVVGDALWCANAGDCRAVLCRDGKAIALSRDHTAALEDEKERVEQAGALVQWVLDGWRVGPAGMQVTRSLGDGDLKTCGVIANPEITHHQLSPSDEFVVLASDGLWDKVSNQEAVDLIHDTVKQPTMCAQRLAMEALARGGEDNVAVVVAFLRPVETTESIFANGVQKYTSHAESYYSTRRAGVRYAASGSRDEACDTY